MRNDLAGDRVDCGSHETGVRFKDIVMSNDDASGQLPSRDWETWIVRIAEWGTCAGQEDSDGIVWPTTEAIHAALQLIQQIRTDDFAEPTEIVPSGDGGIVLIRRTGDNRQEIEISESGDAELLLFHDARLIARTPW